MTEEAATFRVKRAIGYVSALNELRNKHIRYINQTGAWNVANARMVVRCIDLVLQTTHNILCPQVMIEDSEYPELRFATDRGETNYYSDEGEPEDDAHAYGLIKDITVPDLNDDGAPIDRPALRLLGRHVRGSSEDHAHLRGARSQRR